MEVAQLHLTLPRKVYDRILIGAKKKNLSAEQYATECLKSDFEEDEDLVYSKEELFEELKQLEEDVAAGKLPVYDSAEEMFKALDFELDHEG